jgi:casein kinase 1/casein kinase I family protein HRR25
MESLGYVLIYFIRGSFPWRGLKTNIREKKEKLIPQKKESTLTQELCEGLSKEFQMYFKHVQSFRFDETPDYAYLRRLFCNLFRRKGYEYDHVFDWTVLKFLEHQERSRRGPY